MIEINGLKTWDRRKNNKTTTHCYRCKKARWTWLQAKNWNGYICEICDRQIFIRHFDGAIFNTQRRKK